MGKPIITVKNMSFAYGKDNVLTDVNLVIGEQEYVGIIGANGAGKSTLMKLILGQLKPTKGEVEVSAKSIGYVPQVGFRKVADFPANVEEIVMTGIYPEIGMFHFPGKQHRKRVEETLALVGMQEYRKRMLRELSGGQQQRVLIARALIHDPDLLVLDEPLTGIDKEAGELLYVLLDRLNREHGMTILMVTHNMEQVARYTNRFYHVKNGGVHLDKSSILCDEVLKDKLLINRPKRSIGRNVNTHRTQPAEMGGRKEISSGQSGMKEISSVQETSRETGTKETLSVQAASKESGTKEALSVQAAPKEEPYNASYRKKDLAGAETNRVIRKKKSRQQIAGEKVDEGQQTALKEQTSGYKTAGEEEET